MLEKSRLLRPLNFLKIEADHLWLYRWLWPFIITCCTSVYVVLYPQPIVFFGKDSATAAILSLLQLLPGFYIASLAAIATFDRRSMDLEDDIGKVKLKSSENGIIKERPLTRRRFLSYLFGYLSFLSILLFAFGSLLQLANPVAIALAYIPNNITNIENILNWALFLVLILFFAQLITLTLLGLFYLSDRIHWRSIEVEDD